MALENWFEIGKLIKHKTNREELDAIFGVLIDVSKTLA